MWEEAMYPSSTASSIKRPQMVGLDQAQARSWGHNPTLYMWMPQVQPLRPLSIALPGHQQEAGIGSGAARTETNIHIRCRCIRPHSFILCTMILNPGVPMLNLTATEATGEAHVTQPVGWQRALLIFDRMKKVAFQNRHWMLRRQS